MKKYRVLADTSRHTSDDDMADTSPDSPLQPSNPSQALMHILEDLQKPSTKSYPGERLKRRKEACAKIQAYISNVIEEDESSGKYGGKSLEKDRDQLRAEQRERAGL